MWNWNVNTQINGLRHICQVLAKQNIAGLLRGRITETIVSQVLTLDTNYPTRVTGALIGQLEAIFPLIGQKTAWTDFEYLW